MEDNIGHASPFSQIESIIFISLKDHFNCANSANVPNGQLCFTFEVQNIGRHHIDRPYTETLLSHKQAQIHSQMLQVQKEGVWFTTRLLSPPFFLFFFFLIIPSLLWGCYLMHPMKKPPTQHKGAQNPKEKKKERGTKRRGQLCLAYIYIQLKQFKKRIGSFLRIGYKGGKNGLGHLVFFY